MPLIAQQDIIVIDNPGGSTSMAVKLLRDKLEAYPEVRVISISTQFTTLAMGVSLVAVVETI